jgi:hypothetical protein
MGVRKPVRTRRSVPLRPSNRSYTTVQTKPVLVIPRRYFGTVSEYIAEFEDFNHLKRTV